MNASTVPLEIHVSFGLGLRKVVNTRNRGVGSGANGENDGVLGEKRTKVESFLESFVAVGHRKAVNPSLSNVTQLGVEKQHL